MEASSESLLGKELCRPTLEYGSVDSYEKMTEQFFKVSEAIESLNHSMEDLNQKITAAVSESTPRSPCYHIGCFGFKYYLCVCTDNYTYQECFRNCASFWTLPCWCPCSLLFLFSDVVCCRPSQLAMKKIKVKQLIKEKSKIDMLITHLSLFDGEVEVQSKDVSRIFQYLSMESYQKLNFSQLRQLPRAKLFKLIEEERIGRDQLTYWYKVTNFGDLSFEEKVRAFKNEGLIRLFLDVPGLFEELFCLIPLEKFRDQDLWNAVLPIINLKLPGDVQLDEEELIHVMRRIRKKENIEDILILSDSSVCINGNVIPTSLKGKEIVHFSRTGKLKITLENLSDLIELSHENGIDQIFSKCEYYIRDLMIKGPPEELIVILKDFIHISSCQEFLMDYFSEQLGKIDPLSQKAQFRDLVTSIHECGLYSCLNSRIMEIYSESFESWKIKQKSTTDDHKTASDFITYCELKSVIRSPDTLNKKLGAFFAKLCRMKFSFIKHVWDEANKKNNEQVKNLVKRYCDEPNYRDYVERAWLIVPDELRSASS